MSSVKKSEIKDNLVRIVGHIKATDRRWDKACEVAWLLSPAGNQQAIDLHLENLINTYGVEAFNLGLERFNNKKKGA